MKINLLGYRIFDICDSFLFSPALETLIQPGVNPSHHVLPYMFRGFLDSGEVHDSPHWGCHCGWNAWYMPEGVDPVAPYDLRVVAAVRASGRVILNELGWRAHAIEVLALSVPERPRDSTGTPIIDTDELVDPDALYEALSATGARFGVPTFDSMDKMTMEYPPTHTYSGVNIED